MDARRKGNETFSLAADYQAIDGLTISTKLISSRECDVSVFSLGKHTDISPEAYDNPMFYLGISGRGSFLTGPNNNEQPAEEGSFLALEGKLACGAKTEAGFVYLEIVSRKDVVMNEAVEVGKIIRLADLVTYKEGSIVNMDVVKNDNMKLAVMAFDEGCGLSPHRASGDALIFALEGEATIDYEGEKHRIVAGENFRFAKDGLHSVSANGRFKMALLLVRS